MLVFLRRACQQHQHISTLCMFQDDTASAGARHFYIAQWYRDANKEITKQNGIEKPRSKKEKRKSRRRQMDSDSDSETEDSDE